MSTNAKRYPGWEQGTADILLRCSPSLLAYVKQTAMVPYRQCKLTELLFSNSFPSSNQMSSVNRHPQKAIMIVTADPLGDYNATSQILRYSALAREVTVPRAPSVESILSSSLGSRKGSGGRNTSQNNLAEELAEALAEIQRLIEENERLSVRLAEEEIIRAEIETALNISEERCLLIEQEVREECWVEMDEKMEQERKRWQSAWDEQVYSFLPLVLTAANPHRLDTMTTTSTRRLSYCLEDSKVSLLQPR